MHPSTKQQPIFHLRFTRDNVDEMSSRSNLHYDPVCQSLNEPGGMIFKFRNQMSLYDKGMIEVSLTRSDLHLLVKVVKNSPQTFATALCELLLNS
jgi:hypothetical protein